MASSRFFVCWVPFCRTTVAVVLLGLLSGSAFAKTPELSAIEVYPTGDARAYVQISGFTLNAKNEVHLCTGVQTISKNSYGKLPKLTLAPGMSLERAKDGMLLLTRGGAPECVVPANLKLEKAEGVTPSELADKTDLQGSDCREIDQLHRQHSQNRTRREDCPGSHPGHGIGRVPARPKYRHHCRLEVLPGQISVRSPRRRSEGRTGGSLRAGWTRRPGGLPSLAEGWPAKLRQTAGSASFR